MQCSVSISKLKPSILLVLFLVITACQAPPLDINHSMNEDVDVSQYRTFSIQWIANTDKHILNSIDQSISKALINKGYLALNQLEQADLVVRYSLIFKRDEHVKLEQIPAKEDSLTKNSMEAVYEARILVNVIDQETEKVIWKAATTRDLTQVNVNNIDPEKLDSRIEKLFASFPVR